MNLQLFTKWYAKYLIFGIMLLFLLIVPILKGPWVGTDPFLYHRLASDFSFYDSLSYGGRIAAYSFVNALFLIPAPTFLITVLPYILGIISFFLISKILSIFIEDLRWRNLSLLIISLSPAFIYVFSFYNSLTLAVFFAILGFWFYLHKKFKYYLIPIALLLPFCNPKIALCFYIFLFLYTFFIKKDRKPLFIYSLLISAISILIYYTIILFLAGSFTNFSPPLEGQFLFFSKVLFDLGSAYGLGLFVVILFIFGAINSWSKKYSSPFYFLSIGIFLLMSFFITEALVFLSILLAILAALGLIKLFDIHWSSYQYKSFITLILLLGLVFSSISQVNHLIDSMPDKETLDAIEYLSTLESSVVISSPNNGVWVNFAGHKSVIDDNYLFAPNPEERYNDLNNLYYNRDLTNSTNILIKYNTKYIWIDPEMRENLWESDIEGLLFILQYTKNYYTMYNRDGIQIWRVNRDD